MFDSTTKRKSDRTARGHQTRDFRRHLRLNWAFQIPPWRDFAPGSARNDRGTSRPCLLPPMALKSKPPALRVVVDSGTGLPSGNALRSIPKWMVPFICLLILCSCGSQLPFITDDDTADQKVILRNPPKSIAILPFGNRTEEPDLEKFVRTTVYSHLTPHPYQDMELHEVDRRLRRHNLLDNEKFGQVSVKKLGRILGCDAVVLGEVTEFSRVYAGVYSQMAVGASISIWDTRSGEKLWSDQHVTRHHEGGIPLAITDLAFITIRSGLNLRESERVKTVDELSRYLISRLPVPDTGSNGKASKFVSLKRLTKKENSTPGSSSGSTPDATSSSKKLRSLKKLTNVTHQRYR